MSTFNIAMNVGRQVIDYGKVKVIIDEGAIKLEVNAHDRDNNRQVVADLERTLHKFIGSAITEQNLNTIAKELSPIVDRVKQAVIAGVKL